MSKAIVAAFFSLYAFVCSAQRLNIDSAIHAISSSKNAEDKLMRVVDLYNSEINNNPSYVVDLGLTLLKQSQTDNDILEESSAYSLLGHGYRLLGNAPKALEYHQKAIALAEKTNNNSLLGLAENQIGHIYKDREDYDNAIKFYLRSSQHAEAGTNVIIRSFPLLNLGSVYLAKNVLDSALIYSQREYEYSIKVKDKGNLPITYTNLAGVHSKMGDNELAVTYYQLAIQAALKNPLPRYRSLAYQGLAEHYARINQLDTAQAYARKAIASVGGTPFSYLSGKPAKMLADMYGKSNCDSTLKYSNIYREANDSLFSRRANQQVMLMTIDEDLRQQELETEKLKAETDRKQNIQYILLAFGIVSFISLFLLLSRSIITNTRMISFLSVVALLIVFEFLNLLLHPFLERITHHSPVLMLLALVCIAAVLVPLHHKIEHWATRRLVEKNKAIRLAAAKKTIEDLEKAKERDSK
jgi:tetratricopeptide (TPR) repeat protein